MPDYQRLPPAPDVSVPGTVNVGDAFRLAWGHYIKNLGFWLAAAGIVCLAILAVIGTMIAMFFGSLRVDQAISIVGSQTILSGLLFGFLFVVLGCALLAAGLTSLMFHSSYRCVVGERLSVADFFSFRANPGVKTAFVGCIGINLVAGFADMFFAGLGRFVLTAVCIYMPVAAIANPQRGVGDAFSLGFSAMKADFGNTLLLALCCLLLLTVGAVTVVGLLVAIPLCFLLITIGFQMSVRGPIVLPE